MHDKVVEKAHGRRGYEFISEVPNEGRKMSVQKDTALAKLKVLAAIAMADGEIDSRERGMLERVREELGLKPRELEEILSERTMLGRHELPHSRAEKLKLLIDVVEMAAADGRVQDVERRMVGRIAAILELSRDEVRQCVEQARLARRADSTKRGRNHEEAAAQSEADRVRGWIESRSRGVASARKPSFTCPSCRAAVELPEGWSVHMGRAYLPSDPSGGRRLRLYCPNCNRKIPTGPRPEHELTSSDVVGLLGWGAGTVLVTIVSIWFWGGATRGSLDAPKGDMGGGGLQPFIVLFVCCSPIIAIIGWVFFFGMLRRVSTHKDPWSWLK